MNSSNRPQDTNYDSDGGFWDGLGDWLFGENFDYDKLEKALANFFNCCTNMFMTVMFLCTGLMSNLGFFNAKI
jgi:hypothetical protein